MMVRRSMRAGKHVLFVALTLIACMAATVSTGSAEPTKQKQELEVDYNYEDQFLSVHAKNAEAVELFREIAGLAEFKLVTAGFPANLKVDVGFKDIPLEKGIERVVKALRSKASVSQVAVYERIDDEDVLYSLRVTHSGPPRKSAPVPLPAPRLKPKPRRKTPKINRRAAKMRPPVKSAKENKETKKIERLVRQKMLRELLGKMKEEGLTPEEIQEHLQSPRALTSPTTDAE